MSCSVDLFASTRCAGGGFCGACGRSMWRCGFRGPADLALVPGCPFNTMTGTSRSEALALSRYSWHFLATSDSCFLGFICGKSSGGVDGAWGCGSGGVGWASFSGGVVGPLSKSGGVRKPPENAPSGFLRQGGCGAQGVPGVRGGGGAQGASEVRGGGGPTGGAGGRKGGTTDGGTTA